MGKVWKIAVNLIKQIVEELERHSIYGNQDAYKEHGLHILLQILMIINKMNPDQIHKKNDLFFFFFFGNIQFYMKICLYTIFLFGNYVQAGSSYTDHRVIFVD